MASRALIRPRQRYQRRVRLAVALLHDVPLDSAKVVKNLGKYLLLDFGEGYLRLLPADLFEDLPITKQSLAAA